MQELLVEGPVRLPAPLQDMTDRADSQRPQAQSQTSASASPRTIAEQTTRSRSNVDASDQTQTQSEARSITDDRILRRGLEFPDLGDGVPAANGGGGSVTTKAVTRFDPWR